MSFSGWRATTSAPDVVPSANVSSISVAPSITCRLVRMSPSWLTTTPLPSPPSSSGVASGAAPPRGVFVWTRTSDGWTAWYTNSEKAGGGVTDARALAMVSSTSRWVSGGFPGTRVP